MSLHNIIFMTVVSLLFLIIVLANGASKFAQLSRTPVQLDLKKSIDNSTLRIALNTNGTIMLIL